MQLIQQHASQVTAAIVTCGGLCPGLNDVVQNIVYTLNDYGVPEDQVRWQPTRSDQVIGSGSGISLKSRLGLGSATSCHVCCLGWHGNNMHQQSRAIACVLHKPDSSSTGCTRQPCPHVRHSVRAAV